MTKIQGAINDFDKTAWKYAQFGASDTEPRVEFTQILEDLIAGRAVKVPRTIREWQLFSGMSGAGMAARALTRAAKAVIEAAEEDPAALRAAFEYRYGYQPH